MSKIMLASECHAQYCQANDLTEQFNRRLTERDTEIAALRAENERLKLAAMTTGFALERTRKELAAAERERDEARADKERLDWLEQTGDNGEIVINGDLIGERQIAAWNAWGSVKSPRAAIDTARKEDRQ